MPEIIKRKFASEKLISIVIPVYNEEENINITFEVINSLMEKMKYKYEFIFTDNHSTDNSFNILESISLRYKNVKVLRFSRNFGYQKSYLTGLKHAQGDAAIQIDCDLQDPPELIPNFIEYWEKGNKVVYGIRKSRQENWLINIIRKLFYRIINILSEDSQNKDVGDFKLIDRIIIEELKKNHDVQPYIRGLINSMGFQQIGIPYDRNPRVKGESKFKFRELIGLAIDGILNHSIIPLRFATYFGLFVSFLTFIMASIYLFGKIIYGSSWVAGFATTTILILLSLSLNALFLGIIGEYLGRIYKQLKSSADTIIEKKLNF